MQIIPVIDLKNGIVVHAKLGNRDSYAALKSELCKSSELYDVVNVFWTVFHFSTIYIADLNAITQQGDNTVLLNSVLTMFPQLTFWIDSGYPISTRYQLTNFLPVLGSESFQDNNLDEISTFENKFILSLDYSAHGELGAKTLFSNHTLWPDQIIVMNLPRVGSNQGPDIEKLGYYQKKYPQKKFIAAGGIRNNSDLEALEQIGIEHGLVATALHNGSISPNAIRHLQAKKYPD